MTSSLAHAPLSTPLWDGDEADADEIAGALHSFRDRRLAPVLIMLLALLGVLGGPLLTLVGEPAPVSSPELLLATGKAARMAPTISLAMPSMQP